MFDDLNPQGFYPGENLPKLSNPPKKDPQKRSQKKALQLAFLSARWSEPTPGQRDSLLRSAYVRSYSLGVRY